MSKSTENSIGRVAIQNVRLLTYLGLVVGVIVLMIMAWTMWSAQRERGRLSETQATALGLLSIVDPTLVSAREDLEALLNPATPADKVATWPGTLQAALVAPGKALERHDLSLWRRRAELAIRNLLDKRRECVGWRQRSDENVARMQEARAAADAALHAMREGLALAEGRARLAQTVRLRELHTLSDEAVVRQAQELQSGMDPSADLNSAATELAELALLTERLMTQTQSDQLTNFKDNLIRSAIARLQRLADRLDAAETGVDVAVLLKPIGAALFGPNFIDDRAHQTIVPSSADCVYTCRRTELALGEERQRLANETNLALDTWRETCQSLAEVSDETARQLAARIHQELSQAMLRMVGVGLAGGVIFVLLAFRVARAINLQIRAISDSRRELQRANEELEMQKTELQRLLTHLQESNRALEQAGAAAQAASRAKSDFLANMSHEIRTPMTAILGFAETLSESATPEQLDAVRTIQRNGEHLLDVINDILDLTKVEAGKMMIEKTRYGPCHVIAEVESLMRVKADNAGLRFVTEYVGDIPETIETDPLRLRQILINLVGNAIKFTESGTVRLITRCDWGRENPRMFFDVIDSGIGMTSDQVARLFKPFTQADTSTTRKFGGTGLGLAISRRFAELLGGEIVVAETAAGVGTRVRLTVATGSLEGVRALREPRTVFESDHLKPPPVSDDHALHGYRVLLAEDGVDNQRLIAHVLRKAGGEVDIVSNGEEAVEAARQAIADEKPYSVILMDMQMPVMDGYTATRTLRASGYMGAIVALTAHAMSQDRQVCLEAGCDEYATKPIDRKALIAVVRNSYTRVS